MARVARRNSRPDHCRGGGCDRSTRSDRSLGQRATRKHGSITEGSSECAPALSTQLPACFRRPTPLTVAFHATRVVLREVATPRWCGYRAAQRNDGVGRCARHAGEGVEGSRKVDLSLRVLSGRLVAVPMKFGRLSVLLGGGAGVSTETNFMHSYGVDALVGAKLALS